MPDEPKPKDRWDKLDVIAKLIGGISIPLIGVAVSIVLQNQAEQSRKAQLYTQVMSEREKADADIRAQMFKSLLDRYSTGSKDGEANEQYFRDRITFLGLLLNNFQEYFDAQPLLENLYVDLRNNRASFSDAGKWEALRDALFKTSQRVASSQAVLLGRLGALTDITMVEGDSRKIALYETKGLNGLDAYVQSAREDDVEDRSKKDEKHRYSVQITVTGVREDSVDVVVFLYEDRFNGSNYSKSDFRGSIPINVSYFDTPYMKNKRLFDSGKRFSIVYKGLQSFNGQNRISLSIITFGEEFLSLRDRPYFEEMVEKIRENK